MRYKNEDANRYRVNFMIATEKLMDKLTVREFISYLEEKAEFEDTTHEYIDGKVVECKAYDLKEENSNLHKEFLVTSDGRVFYWRNCHDLCILLYYLVVRCQIDKLCQVQKDVAVCLWKLNNCCCHNVSTSRLCVNEFSEIFVSAITV